MKFRQRTAGESDQEAEWRRWTKMKTTTLERAEPHAD